MLWGHCDKEVGVGEKRDLLQLQRAWRHRVTQSCFHGSAMETRFCCSLLPRVEFPCFIQHELKKKKKKACWHPIQTGTLSLQPIVQASQNGVGENEKQSKTQEEMLSLDFSILFLVGQREKLVLLYIIHFSGFHFTALLDPIVFVIGVRCQDFSFFVNIVL